MKGTHLFFLYAADTKRRFAIVEILAAERRVLTTRDIHQRLLEADFETSLRRTHCDMVKITGAVAQVSMHRGRRTHWIYEDLSHLNPND